ncbi:hypothetical protein GCM10027277_55770 [Pseudoduganella ginsengisoli]|nr:AAA family ATPase [Pseudoduganella ginsengisoli]
MPTTQKAYTTSMVWLPQQDGAPPRATRIHGRETVVDMLAAELALRRMVTVTGTGGIGKTTVALAVAEHMQRQWRQGVVYVDLAPLADGSRLAPALAAALVMERPGQRTLDDITAALRSHHMLLVLDSCERLVDDVADMADILLEGTQGLRLLATSCEPLGLPGEWVVQLPPLAAPPGDALDMEQVMHWPAARLFADRMGRDPGDDEAAGIADICRRLDGIPLALELAAANVGVLGVRALARRLGDGLSLQGGQAGRHRTMEAALDWSYALLGEQERQLLRRLSPMRRGFSLDEALHLGADSLAAWPDVLDAFAGLLRQSMLATISDTDARRYRLLETTRRYAAARLEESHDYQRVMARYGAM